MLSGFCDQLFPPINWFQTCLSAWKNSCTLALPVQRLPDADSYGPVAVACRKGMAGDHPLPGAMPLDVAFCWLWAASLPECSQKCWKLHAVLQELFEACIAVQQQGLN